MTRARAWVATYAALIRNAWLVDLQYRAAIGLWLLWGVTEPAIALGIWWAIAGGGPVDGYARADFARYFFALMLVNQLTIAWDSWYLDRWIREGDLNFRLARPLDPVHESIADNIAYKARSGGVILVLWLLVAAVWPAVRLPVDPARWALTVGRHALGERLAEAGEIATVFASCGGDGPITHQICEVLAGPDRAVSPTAFHNSVHNAPAGYWSIATRSRAPSTSLCGHDGSFAAGLLEAATQVLAEGRSLSGPPGGDGV